MSIRAQHCNCERFSTLKSRGKGHLFYGSRLLQNSSPITTSGKHDTASIFRMQKKCLPNIWMCPFVMGLKLPHDSKITWVFVNSVIVALKMGSSLWIYRVSPLFCCSLAAARGEVNLAAAVSSLGRWSVVTTVIFKGTADYEQNEERARK